MADDELTEPVPILDAVRDVSPRAAQSQAALLLVIGNLMHQPEGPAAAAEAGADAAEDLMPADDLDALGIPQDVGRLASHRGRLRAAEVEAKLGAETVLTVQRAGVEDDAASVLVEQQSALCRSLLAAPDPQTAAGLVEVSMGHPESLVRVCAAAAACEIFDRRDLRRPAEMLLAGTYDADELVRDVAAVALARLAPDHPRLAELTRPAPLAGGAEPAQTNLLVHGTFASNASWWQPGGGSFFDYLKNGPVPDLLFDPADPFRWSGGYSDAARSQGAHRLAAWVAQRNLQGLGLLGHSHGASIIMLANSRGLDVGRMVLLSCPVHRRKYFPDFNRVQRVISIRVRFDLVIAADRGGQRFRDPRIEENVLPIWFRHSVTHDPATWRRHGVPAMI
ncbi:MAG: hypothetical protein D6696_04295 [Acidobacteria bacterium]|nr:MAG: hypothetical protein D6696_04295 [Acidobacteriota bacterium]